MRTTYHCCVDLDAICKGGKFAIDAVRAFAPDMRVADDSTIVAEAAIKRARGMEAWPLCNHHTPTGHCKGHPE